MSFESDLRSMLLSNAPLSSLIATRMFPDVLPENGTLPAVVYKEITSSLEIAHDGPTGQRPCSIQFDAYASSRSISVSIRDSITNIMKTLSPSTFGSTVFQGANFRQQSTVYERETRLFRSLVEWEIYVQN